MTTPRSLPHRARRPVECDRGTAFRGQRRGAPDRLPGDLGEVHRSAVEDQSCRVARGERQEVPDEPGQPIRLPDDVLDERPAALGDEVLAVEHLGVRPDERGGCPQLVGGVGDEPPLSLERAPDRDERPAGHDEGDERRAREPDESDDRDRGDEARGLAVVERQDETRLDVAHRGAALVRRDRHGQETNGDAADIDRPEVPAVRPRGVRRSPIREPGQLDPRRIGDGLSAEVHVEDEGVGPCRGRLLVIAAPLCRRELALEPGERRRHGAIERAVHVRVERAQARDGRRHADADHEECDEPERQEEETPARGREQPVVGFVIRT